MRVHGGDGAGACACGALVCSCKAGDSGRLSATASSPAGSAAFREQEGQEQWCNGSMALRGHPVLLYKTVKPQVNRAAQRRTSCAPSSCASTTKLPGPPPANGELYIATVPSRETAEPTVDRGLSPVQRTVNPDHAAARHS